MLILNGSDSIDSFKSYGGGKATNLARLAQLSIKVPHWFCVSTKAYDLFIESNSLADKLVPKMPFSDFEKYVENLFISSTLPKVIENEIRAALESHQLNSYFCAVRSSGLDEDSADHSFAGQFSTFLYQKGFENIELSLKKCWASAYTERALSYRVEKGIKTEDIKVGVVIQKMVNSEISGVSFSRHPIKAMDRDSVLVSSVYGIGEGLVSGELDADHYEWNRQSGDVHSEIVEKEAQLIQAPQGGLHKVNISAPKSTEASLTPDQVKNVAQMTVQLESQLGSPQDCEWGFENGELFCLQTRPITNLPSDQFYNKNIIGQEPTLWDNSNIIESYSGVTSPLTFSFASRAYRQVYIQFCEVVGVPQELIDKNEDMFRNMLGSIRGQIYYNLINWYRLVLMLPGSASNKSFMETMMGVKQNLKPEYENMFEFVKAPPKYSAIQKTKILLKTIKHFLNIDSTVDNFMSDFHQVYFDKKKINFNSLSLSEQLSIYNELEDDVLKNWQPPIINDYLCMVFFGVLKKVTAKWLPNLENSESIQNDLLCGQGNLESTEPTKMLMRIAKQVAEGDQEFKTWLLSEKLDNVVVSLQTEKSDSLMAQKVSEFIEKYGFRCVNELKLEEPDMYDDPTFAVNSVISYVRSGSYDIAKMEENERKIREKAEAIINAKISGFKKSFYYWILKHTRKAVKNRENLRFARTKIFGITRHLIRGVGHNMVELGILQEKMDVFYLTIEEIIAFIEGRTVTLDLNALVQLRKSEYDDYRNQIPAPDRLIVSGAVSAYAKYPQVLSDCDILSKDLPKSDDPNVLIGTPCCPGNIEGVVRVVKDIKDAEGLDGEILVTSRTDPGWVPLYPSCSGLLIERGSLLSHSAVVARELGLPTIVGISGGLMKKLKTGDRVSINASIGEVRILK